MRNALDDFREFVALDRKRGRGLTPEEFERWAALKHQLARVFDPGVSDAQADRRSSIRVPERMRVTFSDLGELHRCWMTNLGRGGVFIATDRLVEIGTRLALRIAIAESGEELEVAAEVVSHNLDPAFRTRSGMGMRFLAMSPDAEKKLDDVYEAALRRAAGRLR